MRLGVFIWSKGKNKCLVKYFMYLSFKGGLFIIVVK